MKYRKKPIVIEAIQWNGDNLQEVMEFIGSEFKYDGNINYFTSKFNYCSAFGLQLYALGGLMSVSINDYIIKGVKGEFYPCKPDIFQATYEVVKMSRLIKDNDTQYDLVGKYNSNVEEFTLNHKLRNDLLNKLGEFEDLEESLGCPLEVVFKAIEDGIVIKGDINQYGTMTLWLDNKPLEALVGEKLDFEEPELIKFNVWCFSCDSGSYRGCVSLKDYGKTWWLKGEVK